MTRDLFVFLLNAAWQAAVFFLVGVVAARALRRASAGAQYVLAVTGLIAASLTPWLSMIPLPNSESLVHRWAWQSRPATVFGLWMSGGLDGPQLNPAVAPGWHIVPLVIALTYGLFIAIQFCRLMHGWLQVRRVVASSRACNDLRVLRIASSLHREDSSMKARVLVSDTARVPFTIGVSSPAVVLPYFLVSDSDEVLALVLAHEFAHIRRRDWIVNLGLLLISLPLSVHPCIALMRKKVEASREVACDELALGCMASASDYARALLDLAGKLAQPQPSLAAAYKGAALGVLDGSTLGDRIRRLMDRSPRFSARQSRLLLAGCLSIVFAASVAVTAFAFASPSPPSPDGSVVGIWQGQFTDHNAEGGKVGHTPIYLQLHESGGTISGVIGPDPSAAAPLETAQLNGNKLRLITSMKQGDITVAWTLDLTVNGDQMSGTGHAVRNDQHRWDVEANLTRKQ
jgi:beta-lactamase regulating signal transducer with metallopeptidase domain